MLSPRALLPGGFRDRLPPEAEAAASLLRTIVDVCTSHGYERVQPPIVEAEISIAQWLGKPPGMALFRSPDPATGEALALRPDITGQIARIAATRLAEAPRPLRLAYAGQVARARGTQLAPERERTQAGAELIGADSVAAMAEIISVAAEALTAAGVTNLSVDLTLPELVPALTRGDWPVADAAAVIAALDSKDDGALTELGAERYAALLEAAGPAETALPRLLATGLAPDLLARLQRLVAALPQLTITIDPTERHGFEYQSWVGFSLFGHANGAALRSEIGRGGAYAVRHADGHAEAAAGFSLYIDALVDAGLGAVQRRRCFLPPGCDASVGAALRADGWATVAALSPADNGAGCTHYWNGTTPVTRALFDHIDPP